MSIKLVQVCQVDDFVSYTLYYELSAGAWNQGGPHKWVFDVEDKEKVEEQIIENFTRALRTFMDEGIEDYP